MKVATLVIAASTMRFAATTAEEITTPLQRLRSQQSRHASSSEEQERRRWGRVLAGDEVAAPTMTTSSSMSMMSMTDGDISMPSLAAMCAFCPDGLTDPDLVLPTDDQATCAMAQVYASTLETADPTCAMVLLAEALCCPPDDVVVGTIFDLGTADSNFSTLMAAVDAAGLAEALQGAGPLAVFGEFFSSRREVLDRVHYRPSSRYLIF